MHRAQSGQDLRKRAAELTLGPEQRYALAGFVSVRHGRPSSLMTMIPKVVISRQRPYACRRMRRSDRGPQRCAPSTAGARTPRAASPTPRPRRHRERRL